MQWTAGSGIMPVMWSRATRGRPILRHMRGHSWWRRSMLRSTSRSRCCSPMWCARWISRPSWEMERLREIMTELVERSAAVVRRYGGTVEYNGDGVMAIFGAPDRIGGPRLFGHVWRPWPSRRRRTGWRPRWRAATVSISECGWGLNSGRVIAGEIGSGSLGYAATGETVGMGAADGIGGAPGWGDAVGVDRAGWSKTP